MKKREKSFIWKLIVVAIIVIVALAVIINNKNNKTNKNTEDNNPQQIADVGTKQQISDINTVDTEESNGENEVIEEKYVQVLEDETKLNTSSKLLENKEFDGISLTNIQLTEKDNVSLLLGNLTNNTQEKKGGYAAYVKMTDENNNELITMYVYVPELDPGESTQLSTNATMDFANAYNFTITKAE